MKKRNCLFLIILSISVILVCNQKNKSFNENYISQHDSIPFVKNPKELTNNFNLTNDQVKLNSIKKELEQRN